MAPRGESEAPRRHLSALHNGAGSPLEMSWAGRAESREGTIRHGPQDGEMVGWGWRLARPHRRVCLPKASGDQAMAERRSGSHLSHLLGAMSAGLLGHAQSESSLRTDFPINELDPGRSSAFR